MHRTVRLLRPALPAILGAAFTVHCGTPITPTPPVPVPDPPKISCPAPVTLVSHNAQPTPVSYGTPTSVQGTPPTTILCTPVNGSLFPIGVTTVSCTATDARQVTDMCTFTVTVTAPPQVTLTRFVAFGDSITWGEDGTAAVSLLSSSVPGLIRPAVQYASWQTYPGVLQQSLITRYTIQTPSVINAGNPGEHVLDATTASRFSNAIAGREVVLIMEGANDLHDGGSAAIPAVIAGLRQMVINARRTGVRPYLATIPPENPAAPCCRASAWNLVPPFNNEVRALAAAEGVTLIDVYPALATDVNFYIGFDGLHPNDKGYEKIAEVAFGVLKSTLETPPPASTPSVSPSGSGFSLRQRR